MSMWLWSPVAWVHSAAREDGLKAAIMPERL